MAFDILTATPEELEAQFPCTNRPFAVWYYPEVEAITESEAAHA